MAELVGGWEALERITDSALAYLSLEELLVELLDRVRERRAADTAAILLLDPSLRGARRTGGAGNRGRGPPRGDGAARTRVRGPDRLGAASGWRSEDEDDDEISQFHPTLEEFLATARWSLHRRRPLDSRPRSATLGRWPRRFDEDDMTLSSAAPDRAAMAIQRAHLPEQRTIAEDAAGRQPPYQLPVVPGFASARNTSQRSDRGWAATGTTSSASRTTASHS